MSFGKQLKKIRLERGLNQEDIGKIVHMGKSTISQWENEIHTPNIDIITRIADYLDVPLDYLAGRTNSRTDYRTDAPEHFETIAAHHAGGGEDWTEEELESIEEFKEFVRMKRKKKQ